MDAKLKKKHSASDEMSPVFHRIADRRTRGKRVIYYTTTSLCTQGGSIKRQNDNLTARVCVQQRKKEVCVCVCLVIDHACEDCEVHAGWYLVFEISAPVSDGSSLFRSVSCGLCTVFRDDVCIFSRSYSGEAVSWRQVQRFFCSWSPFPPQRCHVGSRFHHSLARECKMLML